MIETRVWIPKWKESSLNNDSYKGYIKSSQYVLIASVKGNNDLVRIETDDGKTILVMASDIQKAIQKVII